MIKIGIRDCIQRERQEKGTLNSIERVLAFFGFGDRHQESMNSAREKESEMTETWKSSRRRVLVDEHVILFQKGERREGW